ncbi:GNAT family N-acetyltransferase [Sporosarcina sp. 179-K 3D1 HS]|uniref:GNAT family N-acetyltransferase n=1 Tax=Sporosarcina sp. 179-K 3D1 HS TaxID=3232169 RepID=UPI0039A0CCBB
MTTELKIRLMKTNDEMRLVQELEREVWGMEPIPTHQTVTAVKNGGIMLGAFDGEKLVGFSYSFTGFSNGKTYLCSHMLGVHPEYQLMGIGKLLKDEQMKTARGMGYDLITWTFDPLESRNAYLNTSKLYGICDTYLENCYGEMEDGLNKGLPTDRFQISWWITSERVTGKWNPSISEYHRPFEVGETEKGNPVLRIDENNLDLARSGIEVPIPQHFQLIKGSEPELAMDWRRKTRAIFQQLFAEGYAVVGVNRTLGHVHYYQCVKKSFIPIKPKGEEQ